MSRKVLNEMERVIELLDEFHELNERLNDPDYADIDPFGFHEDWERWDEIVTYLNANLNK